MKFNIGIVSSKNEYKQAWKHGILVILAKYQKVH